MEPIAFNIFLDEFFELKDLTILKEFFENCANFFFSLSILINFFAHTSVSNFKTYTL